MQGSGKVKAMLEHLFGVAVNENEMDAYLARAEMGVGDLQRAGILQFREVEAIRLRIGLGKLGFPTDLKEIARVLLMELQELLQLITAAFEKFRKAFG